MSNTIDKWAGIQVSYWVPVLKKDIKLGSNYKVVPTEGYLAWEYNPLRNYRLSKDMYEKDGKFYTKGNLGINKEDEDEYIANLKLLKEEKQKDPKDSDKIAALEGSIRNFENKTSGFTLREAGELVDFITD
jgi:hypothetical protein